MICPACSQLRGRQLWLCRSIDRLDIKFLWLIVILEAHAQINLKQISGLWGHGERMNEYIRRRELLPAPLLDVVWAKWVAEEYAAELRRNPAAIADKLLFAETYRLANFCR